MSASPTTLELIRQYNAACRRRSAARMTAVAALIEARAAAGDLTACLWYVG